MHQVFSFIILLQIVTNVDLATVTKSIFKPNKKSCKLILSWSSHLWEGGFTLKIGKKLKELRVSHGYTQEELSTILNVSRSTISSWEINRTYHDLSMLVSLGNLYDITIDQLINEDDNLVNTMTNQSKMNHTFKKIILSLSLALISLVIVFVFFLNHNSRLVEKEISSYNFSDYSKLVKKQDDAYFYKNSFIGEIIDTLPNGTETTLLQSSHVNTQYKNQVSLKIERDKENEIDKISVVDTKNTLQLLEDEYGGQIHSEQYDSLEEAQAHLADSKLEKRTSKKPVFIKNDGVHCYVFLKSD